MSKFQPRNLFRLIRILFFGGMIAIFLPRTITIIHARSYIFLENDIPTKPVAIVFGAGLRRDGSPTLVLADRIRTAVGLYKAGKAQVLLMSGDNRFINYDEPSAMKEYAVRLGVPEDAIVADYAGRRTYDTCFRASRIFGVTDAILVTQGYHLPRALFTCHQLGVAAVGIPADLNVYHQSSFLFWNLREIPATLTAFWELFVSKPTPVLGEPEPILSRSKSS